jgi:hypothetical protein
MRAGLALEWHLYGLVHIQLVLETVVLERDVLLFAVEERDFMSKMDVCRSNS